MSPAIPPAAAGDARGGAESGGQEGGGHAPGEGGAEASVVLMSGWVKKKVSALSIYLFYLSILAIYLSFDRSIYLHVYILLNPFTSGVVYEPSRALKDGLSPPRRGRAAGRGGVCGPIELRVQRDACRNTGHDSACCSHAPSAGRY